MALPAPTPVGMVRKSSEVTSWRRARTSSAPIRVVMTRTPQLMSYPTPPGEMAPSSRSTAATPPMGNPYPQWMSGMASDHFTIPGRWATFATCCSAGSSGAGGPSL